jgi:adenine-specific DNA-methyltransferase
LEHSIWLGLMRDRLEIIKRLLADDGSLWITIDDNEAHYLKVMCDEILGRSNYMTSMVWEKDKGRRSDTTFSVSHDYILVYAKNNAEWTKVRNLLERTEDQESRYKNPDNDPRGPWLQGDNGTAKSASEGSRFSVTLPSGRVVVPPPGRGWAFSQETLKQARTEKRVYFGAKGDGMPIIKRYLAEVQSGVVPRTWWTADDAGHNQEAKRDHLNKLLAGIEPFPTPKPERLIHRILHIATNPNDLVLDSFAGSGTTGAVAQKMGRRWIMVELGEHCHTHIIPRLKKVIDGEDKGGITESVGWRGGGGFRYYRLAPTLIVNDRWGNAIINPAYNAAQLAEALAKLEGFVYAPSETRWWQHGHSSERDFIFVTTQSLSAEQLQALADEVGGEQSLLICCSAFRGVTGNQAAERWPNLTLKKIPKMVLNRCAWGHDDYSLNVANLPMAEPDSLPLTPQAGRGGKTGRGVSRTEPDLFGEQEDKP